MSAEKPSPAWHWDPTNSDCLEDTNGVPVMELACYDSGCWLSFPDGRENEIRDLIAAAPAMLELLREAVADLEAQWSANHDERCSIVEGMPGQPPHPAGRHCYCQPPASLAKVQRLLDKHGRG